MRYAGQGYEVAIPCGNAPLQDGALAGLRATFDARHKAMFGHNAPQEPVEVVSYRVRGIGLVPPVAQPRFSPAGGMLEDALRERRPVRFDGATVDCPVYQRERLDVGLEIAGPAVLDQFDCTTVVCPGQVARVDEWKNLVVRAE
jgi:N-methylhydantoinase A